MPQNRSLSKSEVKATGCPFYYNAYYTQKLPQHQMPWTQTGTDFHNFMADYATHLRYSLEKSDLDWVEEKLKTSTITDDAVTLVRQYTSSLVIERPELILGVEQFYAIDEHFQPLGKLEYPGVGKRPLVDGAYAHGTLDLIEMVTDVAIAITDYKTGFAVDKIDDYEAKHYSILAFAYYPWAEEVSFTWIFPRFGDMKDAVTFHRSELPDLQAEMKRKMAIRDFVAVMANPGANPLAGLCGYCDLACPARYPALPDGTERMYPPIQNDDDARVAAGKVAAIRSARSVLEMQLRDYLGKRGPVDLQNGHIAHMATTFSPELQLRTVLAAMGVDVPETSPEFDVPLDALKINNSELKRYAKAKKREGLMETVTASVPTKKRVTLKLGEMDEEEQ